MSKHDTTFDTRETELIHTTFDTRETELIHRLRERANIRDLLRRISQDDLMVLREINHDLRCRIVELKNEVAELRAKLALTESFQAGEPFLDMVENVNKEKNRG